MITDYIGGEGSAETPKNDYVRYGWPLTRTKKSQWDQFQDFLNHFLSRLGLRFFCDTIKKSTLWSLQILNINQSQDRCKMCNWWWWSYDQRKKIWCSGCEGISRKQLHLRRKVTKLWWCWWWLTEKKILFEGESNPRPMSEAEAVQRLFKLDPLSYLWWWWLTKNLCQRCTYLHHKTNHWWWWWWWWWWWERLLKGYKRAPRRRVDHNGSGKMSREKVSFYPFSLLLWWNNGQVLVKRYRCSSVWWNHAHQKGQC